MFHETVKNVSKTCSESNALYLKRKSLPRRFSYQIITLYHYPPGHEDSFVSKRQYFKTCLPPWRDTLCNYQMTCLEKKKFLWQINNRLRPVFWKTDLSSADFRHFNLLSYQKNYKIAFPSHFQKTFGRCSKLPGCCQSDGKRLQGGMLQKAIKTHFVTRRCK